LQKLEGRTFNVVQDNIEKLKGLLPEVFTENKIDIDKLRLALGENVEKEKERYEFTWNGKTEAIQLAQKQTTGTLRPVRGKSSSWDTSKNLYIEGDNLEVIRILQNSYRNKIKLIYIDPPYNTGNDFIYNDDFRDNMKNYREIIGQGSKSNPETNGRFHTDWLNMIYSRLKIARNLLKDDGFIFISIDDTEVTNLKKVCDEIFGEENFLANIIWQKKTSPDARTTFSTAHDYILVYSKNIEYAKDNINALPFDEERKKSYSNPDNDPRGEWASVDLTGQVGRAPKSQFYTIKSPSGKLFPPPEGRCWALAEKTFYDLVKDNRIWFGKEGTSRPRLKKFLSEAEGTRPWTWWDNKSSGHNQEGNKELKKLFNDDLLFDNPKPTKLLKKILQITTNPNEEEYILDFFGGSSSTADAIMQLNSEDGGNRRFIIIQLPESLMEKGNDFKAASVGLKRGYKTISEIGMERIRRAGKKIINEKEGNVATNLDFGFKVFRLDDTNLKLWDEESYNLEKNLLDLVEPLKEGRSQEDVVYEILLKYGIDLTVPIEEKTIAGKTVFSVGMGYLLICLERDLTLIHIEEMAKQQPARIVFYDEGFKDDTVRTNAQQILKRYGVEDIRVI
jgi:adenine-specific DNA-methyltransferase